MSADRNPATGGDASAGGERPGFGFPKRYRLTKTDEFSSVFGFRRAVRSPHFLLHYRPRAAEEGGEEGSTTRGGTARLGVVVPKRLLKAAVRRNLIKRLGREQFRLLRPRLAAKDLVLRLMARPAVLDRKALAAEIRGLLAKQAKRPDPASGKAGDDGK